MNLYFLVSFRVFLFKIREPKFDRLATYEKNKKYQVAENNIGPVQAINKPLKANE